MMKIACEAEVRTQAPISICAPGVARSSFAMLGVYTILPPCPDVQCISFFSVPHPTEALKAQDPRAVNHRLAQQCAALAWSEEPEQHQEPCNHA